MKMFQPIEADNKDRRHFLASTQAHIFTPTKTAHFVCVNVCLCNIARLKRNNGKAVKYLPPKLKPVRETF